MEILPLHRRGNVKKGKSLEDEANALLDELDNEKKKKDEYIAKQQNEIKMKNENEMRLKKEKVLRASCEKQAALLLKERETLNMLTALLQESKAVNQFETSHLELLYSLKTKQEQHTDRMQREKVYLKKMINLKGKEDPLLNEIAQVNSQSGFEFNANIPNSSNDDFLINAGGVATNNNNNFTNAPQFQMNNSGPSMPMYNNISNPIMSNVNMSNSSNNYSEQQQQQQFLISPKSSVAIERLKGLDLQLKEIERTIKGYSDSITHLDALPKPNDLLIIKTSLELLSGKVEQLQSKEIDSVSSFGLTSENEIKNMRKQLNSRCEVLHSLIVKTHTELNTVLDIVNVA